MIDFDKELEDSIKNTRFYSQCIDERAKLMYGEDGFRSRGYIGHSFVRRNVRMKTDNVCALCGKPFIADDWHSRYSIDHILPYSIYNDNSFMNLIPAHLGCNNKKRAFDRIDESLWFENAYTNFGIVVDFDGDAVFELQSKYSDKPIVDAYTCVSGRLRELIPFVHAIIMTIKADVYRNKNQDEAREKLTSFLKKWYYNTIPSLKEKGCTNYEGLIFTGNHEQEDA